MGQEKACAGSISASRRTDERIRFVHREEISVLLLTHFDREQGMRIPLVRNALALTRPIHRRESSTRTRIVFVNCRRLRRHHHIELPAPI